MSLNISVIQIYSAYWNCYIVSQTLIRAVGRRVPCMARNCGKYNIPISFNSRIIWDINIELCNLSRPSGTYTFQINPKILLCLRDQKKTVILNQWSICFTVCPYLVGDTILLLLRLRWLVLSCNRYFVNRSVRSSAKLNYSKPPAFFLWSPPPCMLWERHNGS